MSKLRHDGIGITVLFTIAVVVYSIITLFFSSTVHVEVDEELYLGLAKSFHYLGKFEMGGDILDYNCVLYSVFLSLAYFFYSPRTILSIMRIMGVVCMCSAVFPIWLLAVNILKNRKQAGWISGFAMLMPYMFDSAYIMQEVLSYPLFLCCIRAFNERVDIVRYIRNAYVVVIIGFLNENHNMYVYYMADSKEEEKSYLRNFYGYIIQQYEVISWEEFSQKREKRENAVLLFPVTDESIIDKVGAIEMAERVELNLENYLLYELY